MDALGNCLVSLGTFGRCRGPSGRQGPGTPLEAVARSRDARRRGTQKAARLRSLSDRVHHSQEGLTSRRPAHSLAKLICALGSSSDPPHYGPPAGRVAAPAAARALAPAAAGAAARRRPARPGDRGAPPTKVEQRNDGLFDAFLFLGPAPPHGRSPSSAKPRACGCADARAAPMSTHARGVCTRSWRSHSSSFFCRKGTLACTVLIMVPPASATTRTKTQ